MSDPTKPKRTVNRQSPLGPGEAFDRIADLRDTRAARRAAVVAEFDAEESAKEKGFTDRVSAEHRARLDIMLAAYPEAQKLATEAVASRKEEASPEPTDLGTDGDKSWLTEDPEPAAPAEDSPGARCTG